MADGLTEYSQVGGIRASNPEWSAGASILWGTVSSRNAAAAARVESVAALTAASGTSGAGAAAVNPARDRRRLKALQRTAACPNMLHIFDRDPTRMYPSGAAGWAAPPPPPSTPPAAGRASAADGGGGAAGPAPAATEEEKAKERGALVPAYEGLLTHAAECTNETCGRMAALSCAAPRACRCAARHCQRGAGRSAWSVPACPKGARRR